MASWAVIDSLYCAEQFFCSHLDSISHYLNEAGETADPVCLNVPPFPAYDPREDCWHPRWEHIDRFIRYDLDFAFFLDGYGRAMEVAAKKRIAQVAAITNPLPWEVRKADGAPAFDLVISSLQWMVDAARAAGFRAEHQRLCFDLRARVALMANRERDIPCLFVGTVDGNHAKRAAILRELGDLVTVAPPTFGRSYYELLGRSRVVIHVAAEWAKGERNALRIYEGAGLGAAVISDGNDYGLGFWANTAEEFRKKIEWCAEWRSMREGPVAEVEAIVLREHTYECADRVSRLIEWSRELMKGAP